MIRAASKPASIAALKMRFASFCFTCETLFAIASNLVGGAPSRGPREGAGCRICHEIPQPSSKCLLTSSARIEVGRAPFVDAAAEVENAAEFSSEHVPAVARLHHGAGRAVEITVDRRPGAWPRRRNSHQPFPAYWFSDHHFELTGERVHCPRLGGVDFGDNLLCSGFHAGPTTR